MPAFLISFDYPAGQFGLKHGSHVYDLPEAPSTAQTVYDLQDGLGMEYSISHVAILNWDFLPDRCTHPGGSSPYNYFLTYAFVSQHNSGLGSMGYLCSEPICTLTEVRTTEERIRSDIQVLEVYLVSCKALRESTPQHLQNYEQMRRFNNLE